MKYTPRLPRTNDNVTPGSPVREFFVLLFGLLGIVLVVYVALGLLVDWVVPRISPETERRIAAYFSQYTRTSETASRRVDYLQALTDRLQARCAHVPYSVRIYIVENDMANAVALPGGTIMIFSGLLEKMTSENELAFVISHELGHFSHRDHLRALGRRLVFMALSALLLGSESDVGGMLANSVVAGEMRFSRDQERRADEFGVIMIHCIYGHMGGATDFFEKMKAAENPMHFGQYFSSHPDAAERIRNILDYGNRRDFPMGQRIEAPDFL